eukprot:Clim_evm29s47 gene=Clim_evmTU29s47
MPHAVVTGANSGLGYAICERLLQLNENWTVTICCRNPKKAEDTVKALNERYGPKVDAVILDVSNPKSVIDGCDILRAKCPEIHCLYLNAGILPTTGFGFKKLMAMPLNQAFTALQTGGGILNEYDWQTDDHIQAVYATNVLGHFMMVHLLINELKPGSKVIWTSSNAATSSCFDVRNVEHKCMNFPYESSKRCIDIMCPVFNKALEHKGIDTFVFCPGVVTTNMTYDFLGFLWNVVLPIFVLLRIILPNLTIFPAAGAEAPIFLRNKDETARSVAKKFHSRANPLGHCSVYVEELQVDQAEAEDAYLESLSIAHRFTPTMRSLLDAGAGTSPRSDKETS